MADLVSITHSKPYITTDDIEAVQKTLESGQISSGTLTDEFEQQLADYLKVGSVITVGSGTAALQLSLLALNVGPGDEIILPTYVCRSVMEVVLSVGATPILSDVGECWNMTPGDVESLISPKTKAIIVVHIFGISAEASQFLKFGVSVIEDCCQSFGLDINGSYAGTTGIIGFYSFHATKCLTTGEGGMVLCNDSELQSKIRQLLQSKRVVSMLSDLQSSLGISQLGKYSDMLRRRLDLASRYYSLLDSPQIEVNSILLSKSIFFRFPVRIASKSFETIREKCAADGIHVRRGVDELLHRLIGCPDSQYQMAVKLFNETVSLPIYPSLSDSEQDRIVTSVQNIIN